MYVSQQKTRHELSLRGAKRRSNLYDRKFFAAFIAFAAIFFFAGTGYSGVNVADDMMMGIPMGGQASEPDYDLCPQGVRTIGMFMTRWKNNDYAGMYELIDDKSKVNYLLKDAIFDFQFMEFKEYSISSIRKRNDTFEFMMSMGTWKDGNKELKKIMIDGLSYKIIMPHRGSIFKKSVENYF